MGGYRLIYYLKTFDNILCVLIYSKSDEDNVTSLDIKKLFKNFMINIFDFLYFAIAHPKKLAPIAYQLFIFAIACITEKAISTHS